MKTLRLARARKTVAETQKRVDRLTRRRDRLVATGAPARELATCVRRLTVARKCLRADLDYMAYVADTVGIGAGGGMAASLDMAGASCALE